jgi:thiol-disulfide isomerase/thioredoxin
MNDILSKLRLFAAVLLTASAAVAAEAPTPADTAWKELRKAATPPSPPREWSVQKPSDEELARFNRERAGKALAAADKAKAFYGEFASDKRAVEARTLEYNLLTAVVQLGDSSVTDRMIGLQGQLADDPAVDEEQRLSMVLMAAKSALQGAGDDPVAGMLKAKGVFLKAFEMFPQRAEPAAYLLQLAEMLLAYDQSDAARDIVQRLDKDGIDEDIRKEAKAQMAKFDRIGKPVDIAFTALDGRKIDVAQLKGKVVLIDYWATWCGPCIAGLPELKDSYTKWHPKGFEIVGISLDSDEEALKTMVKEREMPWPQFFDKENENNRYAEKYGITGIPTLWLIDKQGKLRFSNARNDLEGKIAKLMAEE